MFPFCVVQKKTKVNPKTYTAIRVNDGISKYVYKYKLQKTQNYPHYYALSIVVTSNAAVAAAAICSLALDNTRTNTAHQGRPITFVYFDGRPITFVHSLNLRLTPRYTRALCGQTSVVRGAFETIMS